MADNWKFPAAASNKSTVNRLEFDQNPKTGGSLDASKEKNQGPELPVEGSLSSIRGPKRSQTLLPPSVVEGAKKRMITTLVPGTSNTQKHWEKETLKDSLGTLADKMKDLREKPSQQTELEKEQKLIRHNVGHFQELKLFLDETAKQLELSLNKENSLKTLLAEKERVGISQKKRIKELEARLDAEKTKSSMKLKDQLNAYNGIILKLKSTLNQRHEDLKKAYRRQLALNNGKLLKFGMQNSKLVEINASLESQLQVQTQNLKARKTKILEIMNKADNLYLEEHSKTEDEKKRYEAKIAALEATLKEQDKISKAEQEKMQGHATIHLEVLTSEFEEERKHYEAKIAALEAGLEEQVKISKAEQEKMQSHATIHLEVLASELEDERKRYEAKITALEARFEAQVKESKINQENMQKLVAENDNLEEHFADEVYFLSNRQKLPVVKPQGDDLVENVVD